MTTIRPTHLSVLIGAVALVGSLLPCQVAHASVSGEFSVDILVNGAPLREYSARGATYIEAVADAEYSIRLHNRSGRRVAVALAVDGLNSIDARTSTAARASKWVLDPHQSITIEGWQTSQKEARRFFFTTEDSSYGAWLGKTTNLGVIEAVVFRERALPNELADSEADRSRDRSEASGAPSPAPTQAGRQQEAAAKRLPDELAATGIGRRLDNPVRRVHLDLEPVPTASVRIRYEYRPQLVALGVLPAPGLVDPLERREQARGFSDAGFCPVPPNAR